MKFVERRPFADPDIGARKIVEIANGIEAVQDGSETYRAHQRGAVCMSRAIGGTHIR
jgi:hypothetical protein